MILTKEHVRLGKYWDYPKIMKEFNVPNLEETKRLVRNTKIKIADTELTPAELKTVTVRSIYLDDDDFFVLPDPLFYIFLQPRVNHAPYYAIKHTLNHICTIKGWHKANPPTPPELATPDKAQANQLRAGLSKRHLTKQGHYNYDLIQLEMFAEHKKLLDVRNSRLTPKAKIE
jgi:hypothetical protein